MILGNKANTFKAIGLFLLLVILLFAQPAEAQGPGFDCYGQTDIEASECLALEEIYNNTGGGSWNNKSGWLVLATICDDWVGVTCSGTHVSSLSLRDNNLNGSLPPEIGNFPFMTDLDLSVNILKDTLPVDIQNLASLIRLEIAFNEFSGSLPSEIGSLTSLQTLNIGHNTFSGELPASLGNLTSLLTLDIGTNMFSGEIPLTFSALPLDYFDTTDNNLCLPDDPDLQDWYHLSIHTRIGPLPDCSAYYTETPTNTPIPNTLTPSPIPLPTLTPTITTTPTITSTPTLVGPLQTLTALAYEDTLTATANFLKTPSPEPTATKYYILVSQTLVLGGEDQQGPQDAGDQGDDIPIPDEDGGGGLSGLWWLLLIIPIGLIGAGVFLELRGRKAKEEESFSISEEEDDDGFQSFLDDL